MAKLKQPTEFGQLMRDLTSIDASAMTDEMLKAAEPVMLRAMRSHAQSHRYSGEMVASIKSTGVKKHGNGKILVVRPTGTDAKGVRNMEKMAYLEYGTYKQRATPVVTPAVNEAESAVQSAFDRIMDKYLKVMAL